MLWQIRIRCSPICISCQITKPNVHKMYHDCGTCFQDFVFVRMYCVFVDKIRLLLKFYIKPVADSCVLPHERYHFKCCTRFMTIHETYMESFSCNVSFYN